MGKLKTSYIFTKPEMLFLLSCIYDVTPTFPMRYMLSEYLSDNIASHDVIDELEYKKMITKNAGKVSLEPVIDLLVRSALLANKLWVINESSDNLQFIMKAKDMFIHIKSYPLIDGTWRITPYKDMVELTREFDELLISTIQLIDDKGNQTNITPQKELVRLEEE